MRGLVALIVALGPSLAFAGYINFHKDGFKREDIQYLESQLRWYMNNGDFEVTIDLDSAGGDLSGLLGVRNYEQGLAYKIKSMKEEGLKLTTIVGARSKCESACTALFAIGDKRLAYRNSNFMFHAVIIQKAKTRAGKLRFKKIYADRWLRLINEVDPKLASYLEEAGWLLTRRQDWDVSARRLKNRFGQYITGLL